MGAKLSRKQIQETPIYTHDIIIMRRNGNIVYEQLIPINPNQPPSKPFYLRIVEKQQPTFDILKIETKPKRKLTEYNQFVKQESEKIRKQHLRLKGSGSNFAYIAELWKKQNS